ncbi:MAG TPA: flagellar M-ring protein FliF [Coprothermobacter sp.]|nr:flagellar M-ring protein FliF [Coprothermobacter sp.]
MNLENIPVLKDLMNFWKNLEKNQKRNIIIILVVALVAIGGLVYYLNRPQYTLLFSDLMPEQAQAIVSQLESQNVRYKLSSDGASIYVPKDKVTSLRLELASSGLVGSTKPGYELFDNISNIFLTQEEQQIMYQRALEGELERTISAMPGVKSISVHLSLPQRSLWTVTSTQTAQGAVYLTLKPGYSLSANQVEAIRQLVAHAVEGMSPENVVIAEASTGILAGDLAQSGVDKGYLEIKKQLDELYASKIRSFLGQTFGPENIMVSADVDVEVTKQNIQSETWGNTATKNVSDTESWSSSSPSGGPVGTATNVPGAIPSYVYTGTGEGPYNYYRQQQINYEISRTISEIVPQEVEIKNVKIAAIVDSSVFKDYAVTASTVESLIASAAGLDNARGDVALVTSMPFASLAREKEAQEAQLLAEAQRRARLYSYIAVAVLVLLVLAMVFILLRRSRRTAPAPVPAGAGVGGAIGQPRPIISLERPLTPEEEKIKLAMEEIQKALQEHPNDVADLVRMWMQEEWR